MKVLNFSRARFLLNNEYSFCITTKISKNFMFADIFDIYSPSLLIHSGTSHSLLKETRSVKDESKNSTAEKRKEIKTSASNVPQLIDEKKKLKKIKSLTIRPNINYHDMQIKIKQIEKFMDKGFTVALRVENPKNVEEPVEIIFSQVQKSITEQQIPAKLTVTGPVINLIPISAKITAEEKESSSSSDFNLKSKDKS